MNEYGKLLLRAQGDNTLVLMIDRHNLLSVNEKMRGTSRDSALNYIPKSKTGTLPVVASKHVIAFSLRFQLCKYHPQKAEFMGGGGWEAGKTAFKKSFARDNYKHWRMMQAN